MFVLMQYDNFIIFTTIDWNYELKNKMELLKIAMF